MAKKNFSQVGKNYMVLSGSFYSGCVGHCVEAMESKKCGLWLKLELDMSDMWFSESEVKEF